MKVALFLFSVWLPSASSVLLNAKPEIPSTAMIQGLRTSTTVTLSKPICVFSTGDVVEVFGVQTTATVLPSEIGNSTILTYQQTGGGASAPYRAASFAIPTCTMLPFMPSLDPAVIREEIEQYLFRVGNDVQCLNQLPFVTGDCNAPLKENVSYRFKYAVRSASTNTILDETLWSDPIPLLRVADFAVIDTQPGARTGGMVVITTILVILLSLLLCVFVTLLIYALGMKEEKLAMEQQSVPQTYVPHHKNEGFADVFQKEGLKLTASQSPGQAQYQAIDAEPQQTPRWSAM
ncbi:uroplakin-3a-like [Rhinoraja longicauda]